jgi:anti-sigma factor RsiW
MSSDRDLRAAEYVLGTLDAAARDDMRRALAADAALRAAVEAWERWLAPLAADAPPVPPSAELWARIAARLDAGVPRTVSVAAQEQPWAPLVPGVDKKLLHRDAAAGHEIFLLRVAAGARIPAHLHAQEEECFVVAGDLVIGGRTLCGGDLHVAPAGVPHPDIVSPSGAVLYVRGAL